MLDKETEAQHEKLDQCVKASITKLGSANFSMVQTPAPRSLCGIAAVDEPTALLDKSELWVLLVGTHCGGVGASGILADVIQTQDRAVRTPTRRRTSCKNAPKFFFTSPL